MTTTITTDKQTAPSTTQSPAQAVEVHDDEHAMNVEASKWELIRRLREMGKDQELEAIADTQMQRKSIQSQFAEEKSRADKRSEANEAEFEADKAQAAAGLVGGIAGVGLSVAGGAAMVGTKGIKGLLNKAKSSLGKGKTDGVNDLQLKVKGGKRVAPATEEELMDLEKPVHTHLQTSSEPVEHAKQTGRPNKKVDHDTNGKHVSTQTEDVESDDQYVHLRYMELDDESAPELVPTQQRRNSSNRPDHSAMELEPEARIRVKQGSVNHGDGMDVDEPVSFHVKQESGAPDPSQPKPNAAEDSHTEAPEVAMKTGKDDGADAAARNTKAQLYSAAGQGATQGISGIGGIISAIDKKDANNANKDADLDSAEGNKAGSEGQISGKLAEDRRNSGSGMMNTEGIVDALTKAGTMPR
ncbi:hypothetical protein [Noviherbaspirillum galbum]|uniref:Uncharacterized protein n=1 Tax=Noviherbaspirillum galbum TaxID=2709383 RepID=A0A6B3SU02_9BURK|nr:hypothetical protein [Noviherbaspirillum galbum]NEX64207.1 hypothetical protein [Noviherbaspirillum galbum]